MKMLILIISLSSKTWASGCDFYHYERHVESKWVSQLLWSDYQVVTRSDRHATIKLTNGEIYNLNWIRTEKHPSPYSYTGVHNFDLNFYEGSGCGPTFECISGQIRYTHVDETSGLYTTYVYPEIYDDMADENEFQYLGGTVIPVFGSTKLSEPSLAITGGYEEMPLNRQQCAYIR